MSSPFWFKKIKIGYIRIKIGNNRVNIDKPGVHNKSLKMGENLIILRKSEVKMGRFRKNLNFRIYFESRNLNVPKTDTH